MSGLGLGFRPTETGVQVVIVRGDRSRVGYIDYTLEQSAQVANQLLGAMSGKPNTPAASNQGEPLV